MRARAATSGGGRQVPAPVSEPEPKARSLGSAQVRGTVLQRIAPAPSRPVQRLKGNRMRTVAMVCAVPVWNDPLQRFRPNRCNRSDSKLRLCPSRSAINSAPFSHFKTHSGKTHLSLLLQLGFRSESEEVTRILK